MNYAVIMAGGAGTRLWPMSRDLEPKQFQSLVNQNTLIQDTFERLNLVLPVENIFISTNTKYLEIAKKQLPLIPENNFIVEPAKRNTAPALCFVANTIIKRDPEATITTYVSDHVIQDKTKFSTCAQATYDIINKYPEKLVIIGITPDKPDTNLGYIKSGPIFDTIDNQAVVTIEAFLEKPDLETAKTYLSQGNYLWNAAYYGFKASKMLEWMKEYLPKTYDIITQNKPYEEVENQQWEPTILQNPNFKPNVLMIPATYSWSDVGTWDTLHDVLSTNEKNVISRGNVIDINSKNCLIYGDKKLITTLGLEDIIIVDTPDVTLITNKKNAPKIKDIIEKLDPKYQ